MGPVHGGAERQLKTCPSALCYSPGKSAATLEGDRNFLLPDTDFVRSALRGAECWQIKVVFIVFHRSPNVIAFSSEIVGSHSMFPVGGNVNQFNHNRKWYGGSSNFFLNKTTRQSSNPTSGCISKGKEVIMLKRYLNTC